MYIETNGDFYLDGDKIIFINHSTKRTFKISGVDKELFLKVLPFFTGTIPLDIISLRIGIPKENLFKIVLDLEKLDIVTLCTEPKFKIIFTSSNLEMKDIKILSENEVFKHVSSIEKIEDVTKADFVIAIDKDESSFFCNLDKTLTKLRIPWLKISFTDNDIYMGPLFLHDGGPCFNCYKSRLDLNKNKSNSLKKIDIFGDITPPIYPLLEREIIKLFNQRMPSIVFEKEYHINLSELSIKSFNILQLPHCEKCRGETVAY